MHPNVLHNCWTEHVSGVEQTSTTTVPWACRAGAWNGCRRRLFHPAHSRHHRPSLPCGCRRALMTLIGVHKPSFGLFCGRIRTLEKYCGRIGTLGPAVWIMSAKCDTLAAYVCISRQFLPLLGSKMSRQADISPNSVATSRHKQRVVAMGRHNRAVGDGAWSIRNVSIRID